MRKETAPTPDDPLWGTLITTIVNSGRGDVEQGALEAALTLGRRCAGWCGAETPPEKRQRHGLEETAGGRQACLDRNTRAADGTMIVTLGPLTEGNSVEVATALRCKKPFVHLREEDLIGQPGIASGQLKSWVLNCDVYWLHVTSPTSLPSSDEFADGRVVRSFLERSLRLPESVAEAAEMLSWEMPTRARDALARSGDNSSGLALYVRNAYGLFRKGCAMSEGGERADDVSLEIVARARGMIADGKVPD